MEYSEQLIHRAAVHNTALSQNFSCECTEDTARRTAHAHSCIAIHCCIGFRHGIFLSTSAGQTFAHRPQPTHLSFRNSGTIKPNSSLPYSRASLGQTFMHAPQPQHMLHSIPSAILFIISSDSGTFQKCLRPNPDGVHPRLHRFIINVFKNVSADISVEQFRRDKSVFKTAGFQNIHQP